MPLQIRRGTDDERTSVVFANGEIVYTTDTQQLYVGDGSTPGGNVVSGGTSGATALSELSDVFFPTPPTDGQALIWDNANSFWKADTITGSGTGITDIIQDTSPQLGGNLDNNGFDINGSGNIAITGSVDSRGLFSLGVNDVLSDSDTIRTFGVTRATSTSANLGAQIAVRRARGSSFTPSTVSSGDLLSDLLTQGYDGASYVTSTAIRGRAVSTLGIGIMPGQLEFHTADAAGLLTERLRINSFGTIISYGTIQSENIELSSEDSSGRLLGLSLSSEDNIGSALILRKSRGTVSANTVVSTDDIISNITAQGYDGSGYQVSSRIIQRAVSSISTGIVPGNIEFYTTNSSGTLQQRLELTHDGFLNVGGNITATGNVVINGYYSATNEDPTDRMIDLSQYNSTEPGITVALKKGGGTATAPVIISSNDIIGNITAQGYDGSTFQTSSRIIQRATGTVGSGIIPGQIEFYTTNSSGTSSQRLVIDNSGIVSITGGLTVGATVTTSGNVRFDNTTYTSGSYVLFRQYHNTADASNVTFARYRGTSSVPTAVLQNDKVADLTFTAYDGTSAIGVGGINLTVTGAVGTSSIPTRLAFLLHDGTSNATRLTIDNQGIVDFKAPELVGGVGSGQVDVSAVAKWMKIKLNGVEYAVPAYAINP